MNIAKPYQLRNKKTGAAWRGAKTRAEARALKKSKNFMHIIVRTSDEKVIR